MDSGGCQEPERYFECERADRVRYMSAEKRCNTIEGGLTTAGREGRDEKRNGARPVVVADIGRERVTSPAKTRRGEGGTRRIYTLVYSRETREINGSGNRAKPVSRTKDTLPASPESRAERFERREGKKRRKNRIGELRDARERTKREGLTQDGEKRILVIPMAREAGNLPLGSKARFTRSINSPMEFYNS